MRKLRHTAVVILQTAILVLMVGWYLFVPPQTRFWWIGAQRYDDAAPLSRWTIDRSFDKAQACEAARLATQEQAGDGVIRMNHAVCVASDDPRLRPY